MLKARFGSVDVHGGCSPSKSTDSVTVKSIVVLTSKAWRGIRLPVLRKAIRLGAFLESARVMAHHPRLVIQIVNGKPITIRPRRFLYRVSLNRYGGELFMAQTYGECIVHGEFGVHLGTIELQYPLFAEMPRQIKARAHLSSLGFAAPSIQPLTITVE